MEIVTYFYVSTVNSDTVLCLKDHIEHMAKINCPSENSTSKKLTTLKRDDKEIDNTAYENEEDTAIYYENELFILADTQILIVTKISIISLLLFIIKLPRRECISTTYYKC
ncbi:jg13373 [Pararge aegeria aegeria]|uniref:Jg13373 protein n=1 Tax=Pararge aegeria aegeria TaxID=348720 RepID=A0A8S4S3L1_9NEOP|nr:jg13373 [Pararge aegeria aegeria]